jgi:uncharacterized protein (TIGR01777 family)
MKQTVLITGANGFIARHLAQELNKDYSVKFLSTHPKAENEFAWDLEKWVIDEKALEDVDYIVHLSGMKFDTSAPFTEEKKKKHYDSRVGASNFLKEKLAARGQKLKAFVSASAVGYYSFDDKTNEIDENGNKAANFAADLCADWESAAEHFKKDGIASRVSIVRVPVVLGSDGGMFSFYLSKSKEDPSLAEQQNNEPVSWNHIKDMAGVFAHLIKHDISGTFNAVAPMPASVQDLYKAIANKTQQSAYQLSPFSGKHLVSNKIIDTGYVFKYPDIQIAVNSIVDGVN